MKSNGRKGDAWMAADGGDRPGRLHALLVNGRRMGYPAWLCYGALFVGGLVMIFPVVLLVSFADRLGVWWAILLLLYMAILIGVYALIIYPREMERIRYILGDEAFFLAYPKERKRELRRQERLRRKMARR